MYVNTHSYLSLFLITVMNTMTKGNLTKRNYIILPCNSPSLREIRAGA